MAVQIRGIILSIAIGLAVFALLSMALATTQAILLGLVAMLVVLWSNEALPLGLVSLLPIIFFPMFDILSTNVVTPNYAKSIVFLFLGGFMLAIAVEKTLLHKVISDRMLQVFPSSVRGMIFALAITSGALSLILANTTTTLLLMPIALYLSDNPKLKMRFALAIAFGASIGGIVTPIGTPPNLILYGVLDDLEIPPIPFMQWVIFMLPLAVVMMGAVGYVLSIGTEKDHIATGRSEQALTKNQKKVALAFIVLAVLLFANSPIRPYYEGLGLNEKSLLLGFGLLMFIPPFNILDWEDMKKVPYEIIFLFGAGFSIAMAVTSTGLADELARWLGSFSDLPVLLLILIIAGLVTFTTEITSNTAIISMILPVIYAVTKQKELDVRLFMMVATVCSSYAFMLPIATPPNAIAMSSGAVHVKTMAKYGIIFNLLGILFVSMAAMFYWRYFL